MSSILNEEASILHQALLNCIRRCEDSHGRRAYLCLIEHVISGCPGNQKFYTTFYDQLSLSIEEINKTVMFEIQQCKMEQQVSSLGLDCSPPKNDLNVIPDKSVLNTEHDVMADDSSDDSDFIDLNDLIFESVNNDFELLSNENIALNSQDSIASSFDLQLNLNTDVEQPSEIELDDGVFLPTDNIDLKCAPEQDDKQKSLYSSPIMPDPLVDVNNQVRPCSLSLNEAGVYVPVNAPSSAPAQLTSRIPMSTRPPGTVPPPISVYPVAHARPPGPRLPGATRPPISDSPVTYTQPPGTAPPPIISDYPVAHGTRPPGTASPLFTDYPITHTRTPGTALPVSGPPFTQTRPPNVATAIADSRPPITPSMNGILAEPSEHFKFVDIIPNSDTNCTQHDFPALVSPNPESNPLISTDKTDQSTRAPAGAIPIGISNAVPKVPFTLVRPRGFLPVQTLPSPTEPTPPTSSRPSVTPVAQRPFTSDAMPPPPPRTPTTPDEYPSPRYETRALPDNLSRQNTRSSSDYSSADLGDSKEYHRSSSGESGGGSVGITKPDTHRGSTVYRSKRISHSQLLAFLDDSTLKSDLKELGAVYLISACDDANFYNVSLSGSPNNITQISDLFDYSTDPDALTPISLDIVEDREEPGSIALAVGTKCYLRTMMAHIHPHVVIKTYDRKMVLNGCKRNVYAAAQLVEYFLESPRKRVGTLFHVPDEIVEHMSAMRTHISRITGFAKGKIPEVTDLKTKQSYVFCMGLPHVDNHYLVNKYLLHKHKGIVKE